MGAAPAVSGHVLSAARVVPAWNPEGFQKCHRWENECGFPYPPVFLWPSDVIFLDPPPASVVPPHRQRIAAPPHTALAVRDSTCPSPIALAVLPPARPS